MGTNFDLNEIFVLGERKLMRFSVVRGRGECERVWEGVGVCEGVRECGECIDEREGCRE